MPSLQASAAVRDLQTQRFDWCHKFNANFKFKVFSEVPGDDELYVVSYPGELLPH